MLRSHRLKSRPHFAPHRALFTCEGKGYTIMLRSSHLEARHFFGQEPFRSPAPLAQERVCFTCEGKG